MSEITQLTDENEWQQAFSVLHELWPDLEKDTFIQTLHSMTNKGYMLFGVKEKGKLVSVAGVQEIELLYLGKILWLFDMATFTESQGEGYGKLLLKYLQSYAERCGYARLLLHTSTDREETMKFYKGQLGEPFGAVFRTVIDSHRKK